MEQDLYRIECIDGDWTVKTLDGYGTYYFGDNRRDCEEWVREHNGEVSERIIERN